MAERPPMVVRKEEHRLAPTPLVLVVERTWVPTPMDLWVVLVAARSLIPLRASLAAVVLVRSEMVLPRQRGLMAKRK